MKNTAPSKNLHSQPWLTEERDACGVGFIATLDDKASYQIVSNALTALNCLEHRGGCSADRESGDGSGIMTQIPWELFAAEVPQLQPYLNSSTLAVGMIFLPQEDVSYNLAKETIEKACLDRSLEIIAWRCVPVNPETLGIQARQNQPRIEQIFLHSNNQSGKELERLLYLVRRQIEKSVDIPDLYICSFDLRTIVYKGMVRSQVLGEFYLDLQNPAYISKFAIYHRRFSTNTMPKWPLAQPMRMLGHNGEINTLLGNINWMKAKEPHLHHPVWEDNINQIKPLVSQAFSDSANLDRVVELLVNSDRTPQEAISILVPEAYQNHPDLVNHPEITDFYDYYSGIQEAWDGPALLVFSDGLKVGAALDRNGLRPARYCRTRDNLIILSSEAGVIDIPPENIVEKKRLGPGEILVVDLETREVLNNYQIKQQIASQYPYGEWLQKYRINLETQPFAEEKQLNTDNLLRREMAFGYTSEDVEMIVEEMAATGKEPTFCMGDDTPLAVLSSKPHTLYDYFKQRFAQVTNPPIDPLRENIVMSLNTFLGEKGNILEPQAEFAKLIKLKSPVLNEAELNLIQEKLPAVTLSTLYPIETGPQGLEQAVKNIVNAAAVAVRAGNKILVISDRGTDANHTISDNLTYIPPLLAVGAIHHHLIRENLRTKASLIVDTAQCWSTHHFACLIGYGASAVCPYLSWEIIRHWHSTSRTESLMKQGKIPNITVTTAQQKYRKAVEDGLFKILSKMGISLLSSYQGAQIFEAIGIGADLLEIAFTGTASRVGGITLTDLAQETIKFHNRAFPEITAKKLENFGFIQYRPGGEYHLNSPEMAKALHKAITFVQQNQKTATLPKQEAEKTAAEYYKTYTNILENRPVTALRDLLDFVESNQPVPLDEVESVEEIVTRFCTGGMSLGALSREAHETLAIAMNRIGGKSNSGEGGEDPIRYSILNDVDNNGQSPLLPHLKGLQNGDTASSAIKQVASGRFGVTPEYLMHASQIEIKMAQGAKPGEGGQLPGTKVSSYIAMLRRSKPGVTLISPPPHHDIYSIEDLAQLIFDLHQINPDAKVSVKLVAEIGIGTIAAGVAKANADVIQISGHDGGTGASPLSSIKHAGSPWELGLTEVHRTLLENELRDRVVLRVDGGLKSGWDVVMAALLGAEEFGFGSIAMIAEGCIMARICHTNNCPVGVATQQEKLRQRFPGTPAQVVNFFYYIAEEVRAMLSRLGYRSLQEIIGRSDLLQLRPLHLAKTESLDLDTLLHLPDVTSDRSWLKSRDVHSNGVVLDDEILSDSEVIDAIQNHGKVTKEYKIINTDRTVGARIAGQIAQKWGNNGWQGKITLHFSGSAGQSFAAFNLPGMTLILAGEANDYVGKGMHGGEVIIKPPVGVVDFPGDENVIIGNTCLYGATGGILLANGKAGERFAVRNSQATAVIEGAGDHCCEYMTGGTIVVLGNVGRNVGAGMTGGLGYFLDENDSFPSKVNGEIVKIQRIATVAGEQHLKDLILQHFEKTGSAKAGRILSAWDKYLPLFWQVVPPSEAQSPEVI